MLDPIAELIVAPIFIWSWCGLIVLYALADGLKIFIRAHKIRAQIRQQVNILAQIPNKEAFSDFIKEFYACATKSPLFAPIWRDAEDYLHYSDGNKVFPHADQKGKYLVITRNPRRLFHVGSVIRPVLDRRNYAATGSQLTVLGILGNFFGLAAGVYLARAGLVQGDVTEMHGGLAQLLSGASLAFLTSITGILCSVGFARFERAVFSGLAAGIETLLTQIRRLLPATSKESFSVAKLNLQRSQLEILTAVNHTLGNLRSDRSDLNQRSIATLVEQFVGVMNKGALREIESVSLALSSLSEGTRNAVKILEAATKKLNVLLDNSSSRLTEVSEVLCKTEETMLASSNTMKENLGESCKSVIQVISAAGEVVTKNLDRIAGKVMKDIETSFDRYSRKALVHSDFRESVAGILQAIDRFKTSMAEIGDPTDTAKAPEKTPTQRLGATSEFR